MTLQTVKMPDVEFHRFFDVRVSEDNLARANRRSVEWLTEHRITTSAKTADRYLDMRLPEFAMMLWPSMRGEALDIGVDVLAWCAFFDDLFDGPPGRSAQAAAACVKEFIAMTFRPPGTPAAVEHPLATAWVDVWRREAEGMSRSWQARAAANWRTWFTCMPLEAANRAAGRLPPLADYLEFRRVSLARGVLTDVIEGSLKFEVPEAVINSVQLQGILNACTDSISWVNDVYSLPIDELRGEVHNLVLILQHEQGLTRQEAIEQVVRMEQDCMKRWLRFQEMLPVLCDACSLTEGERVTVQRYVSELQSEVTANYDWSKRTGRYKLDVAEQAHKPAWSGDLPSLR